MLTDKYFEKIKTQHVSVKETLESLNKAILQAAIVYIPRGAIKNYEQYWEEELLILDDKIEGVRKMTERGLNLKDLRICSIISLLMSFHFLRTKVNYFHLFQHNIDIISSNMTDI